MKHTQHDIQRLHAESKGARTFLLFLVLATIVALAVYSAKRYRKVHIEVEQAPSERVVPERSSDR